MICNNNNTVNREKPRARLVTAAETVGGNTVVEATVARSNFLQRKKWHRRVCYNLIILQMIF